MGLPGLNLWVPDNETVWAETVYTKQLPLVNYRVGLCAQHGLGLSVQTR